jgi:hypothetical protein
MAGGRVRLLGVAGDARGCLLRLFFNEELAT